MCFFLVDLFWVYQCPCIALVGYWWLVAVQQRLPVGRLLVGWIILCENCLPVSEVWEINYWSIDWIVMWSPTLLWALSIMFYYCQRLTQCRIVHLAQALEDYILDFGAYMGGVFWKLLLRYPLHCIHTNRQCRTAEEVRVSSGDRTVRTSPANSIQSCTFTS